ncbi:MAG: hypothetical protein NC922_02015 [Candidatus Omnitrophica bacterium]|nr:hypothetical protein [Candidatus Omnitrophota bacterium]
MDRIIKKGILCGLSLLLLVSINSFANFNLPSGTIIYEAEDFVEHTVGKIKEDTSCSGGKYISWPKENNYLHILRFPAPEKKDIKYAIWIRHKGCSICLKDHEAKEITWIWYRDPVWKWNKFGDFSFSQLGESFVIMTSPHFGEGALEGGIDCVIVSPSLAFTPEGIYTKQSTSEQEKEEEVLKKNNIIKLEIDFSAKKGKISPYLASANINGITQHLIDNKDWDKMMQEFFKDGLLRAQVVMFNKPDGDGNWWNFKEIDRFIKTARERWGVKKILIGPSLKIPGWDYKSKITENQILKSKEALQQLVRRYGSPGNVSVEYWEAANEWWGGYWEKNPKEFVQVYTYLCKAIKEINPDLKVGGPVDAWPTLGRIEALLKSFPELDFISWHFYPTGSAGPNEGVFTDLARLQEKMETGTSYRDNVLSRASQLASNVIACQKISEKILGKKIPVIVSEYHLNYHAWDPVDPMMCSPFAGVWNALALTYLCQSDCFSGMIHDVKTAVYGLFGPADGLSVHFRVIPAPSKEDENKIYIRPIGHIHHFFIKHIAGKERVSVSKKGASSNFEVIAATDGNERSIVMVNYSSAPKEVRIKMSDYLPKFTYEFNFPVKYLHCTSDNISKGEGLFFNTDGEGVIMMQPYSVMCLYF